MTTGRVGYLAGYGHDAIRPHLSAEVWDPFYPFPALQQEAGYEWRETADAHVLTARVPGAGKEEVKVEVEGGRVLKISGEWRTEKEEVRDTWRRAETRREQFLRHFRLPENASAAEVTAAMQKDGVLTVTVPKIGVKVIRVV